MNILFLVAFAGLPLAYYLLTRSLTRLALGIVAVVTITGGLLELGIAFGLEIHLGQMQWLLLIGLAVLAVVGVLQRRHDMTSGAKPLSWRRQLLAIWLPALAFAALFIGMRLAAGSEVGWLTGVGFLVNHEGGEDNAKWLQLASLMASDRPMSFVGGYSGGPLIMLMTAMATLISVLSTLSFGGVNEVAVVVGTVIGSSMLLPVLAPFALAPLAETRVPSRRGRGVSRMLVPTPAIWAGALALFGASTALTTFGHLSLQFVIPLLVLWTGVYLTGRIDHHARALATIGVIGAAVVWFPLVPVGAVVLVALVIWAVASTVTRLRAGNGPDWPLLGLVALTLAAGWDGLISALLWVVGIGVDTGDAVASEVTSIGGAVHGIAASVGTVVGTALLPAQSNLELLFGSPGGTEFATPVLSAIAFAVLLLSVSYLMRALARRDLFMAYLPLIVLGSFMFAIAFADALITGKGNSYATMKMQFTVTIIVIVACLPLAIVALQPAVRGMTVMRWTAVIGVVFLLSVDTILPRGIAQFAPTMWREPDQYRHAYAGSFEVQPVAHQPVSSLPIACVFLPPGAAMPSGQPNGQITYNCTRLAIGLSGAEGRVGGLNQWLMDDWGNNGMFWNDWYESMAGTFPETLAKPVVLLGEDNSVIGYDTLQGLLKRFPPTEQ